MMDVRDCNLDGICAEEYCMVCYTDTLCDLACVRLSCKHVFHLDCVRKYVTTKPDGARITFGNLDCPLCKERIDAQNKCPQLEEVMKPSLELEKKVKELALYHAKEEGLNKNKRLEDPDDFFYHKFEAFAVFKTAFYSCHKCKKPYFGGLRDCADIEPENIDPTSYECLGCKVGAGEISCEKHGKKFIDWKCRWCCKMASWTCYGLGHFCDPCHDNACNNEIFPCPGAGCELGFEHPPNGQEFALGCRKCRLSRMKFGLDEDENDEENDNNGEEYGNEGGNNDYGEEEYGMEEEPEEEEENEEEME